MTRSRLDHYILIGQTPVPVEGVEPNTPEGVAKLLEWASWFENRNDNRVAFTKVLGLCEVSTVFLGLDHNFGPYGPPLLFETMAFWPDGGWEQTRASTWLEAEAQHAAMCRYVTTPAAVLSWVWRAWREYWADARRDLGRIWRDMRGIPPSEIEVLMDRMAEAKRRRE